LYNANTTIPNETTNVKNVMRKGRSIPVCLIVRAEKISSDTRPPVPEEGTIRKGTGNRIPC
jgi:hypothetical protein